MIKLSIIIPYYNAKPYTDELLSLLDSQITKECEVIIIDDGSDEPYSTSYEWAKIIHQANGGASAARNTGLDTAVGKYVAFIDADDRISENYISTIINKINEEHFDYCYLSWDSFGGWDVTVKLNSVKEEFPNWNLCLWNRIWKRDLIGNIRLNTKKAIAEDAEFIREVPTKGKKKSFISEIMYHYRSDTPNSLTKRFNNGELDMNRVVYHYNHITSDMTWLVEEVKETNKNAEVIILTNQNDIPELSKYAMIMKPNTIKGTELRGEQTNHFIKINKPLSTQVVIWTERTFEIGGIETSIYNFCMNMKDDYDITVLYSVMDKKQIERLEKYVRVEKLNPSKTINCDTLIVNRITDAAPVNIKYKKKVQMVHCCQLFNNWHVPQDNDLIVPVSNVVANSYPGEIPSEKSQVVYNFTNYVKPKRALRLISATRLTFEKGEDRIIKFAKLLTEKDIPFVWTIFADKPLKETIPGIVIMKPTLDVRNYVASSDYLVQFSDSEAFCYSIVEALEMGIPVITTPIPVLEEIKFIEGVNGWTVPFNMENIDIDKIYNSNLSFEYNSDNEPKKNAWKNILGNTIPKHDYVYDEKKYVTIRAIKKYYSMALNKNIMAGEIRKVTKERADQLVAARVAVIQE